jgi:hypothetical protein
MTVLLIFVLGGVAAIGIVLLLQNRTVADLGFEHDGDPEDVDSDEMLLRETRILEVAECIFSIDDWNCITLRAPQLKKSFLRSRTRLALQWLRRVNLYTRKAQEAYIKLSRISTHTEPFLEFRMAVKYFYFVWTWRISYLLILCFGPFRARRACMKLADSTGSLRRIWENILARQYQSIPNRVN